MKRILRAFKGLFLKISNDNISSYAAESAFFIIMSLIPFLSIILTFINFLPDFFPVTENVLIDVTTDFLPAPLDPLAESILLELFEKNSGKILSVSILTLLWPSAKGVYALIKGLDAINNEKENINFFKLVFISILYTIFFILIIIMLLALLVFGNKINSEISKSHPTIGGLINVFLDQKYLISFIILTLFFVIVFKLGKGFKTAFFSLIPGAAASAVFWIIFSYIYSVYISKFSKFSYTYGSLATIILLMIWLYFGMYFLFIGAEINSYFAGFINRVFYSKKKNNNKTDFKD